MTETRHIGESKIDSGATKKDKNVENNDIIIQTHNDGRDKKTGKS